MCSGETLFELFLSHLLPRASSDLYRSVVNMQGAYPIFVLRKELLNVPQVVRHPDSGM